MLLCKSGNTALLAVQWADAKQPRHQEECLCMSADLQTWLAVIVPGILPGARSDHQVPAEMSCKQQQQVTAVGMTLCMPLPEPAETALAHLPPARSSWRWAGTRGGWHGTLSCLASR